MLFALVLVASSLAQVVPVAPASASTGARPTPQKPSALSWAQLSAPQRQALAPLERDWATIDSNRKAKWLDIAARFPKMPTDEQQRVQARMTEWARLTPSERGRARLSFQEAQQLSPQERKARWEAYQSLPEAERKALAAKAAASAASRPQVARASSASLGSVPKQNVAASAPKAGTIQPIAPTFVQARPGATTTLITKSATPPLHQQPGQPKIAARPGQVDRSTMLPRVAAASATPASAGSQAPSPTASAAQ